MPVAAWFVAALFCGKAGGPVVSHAVPLKRSICIPESDRDQSDGDAMRMN
jgi:hypothetical protein